jgi:hypothetical protein
MDSLARYSTRLVFMVKHGMAQQPICFCLIPAAICVKPFDDVGIEAHRDRFLLRPIKLADLGAAPIEYWTRIRKINVVVTFYSHSSDISFLLFRQLPHMHSCVSGEGRTALHLPEGGHQAQPQGGWRRWWDSNLRRYAGVRARSRNRDPVGTTVEMAERVGFEPTVEFPLHSLSRRALSTTQTPLRVVRTLD